MQKDRMRIKKFEIKCNECGKQDVVPTPHKLCLVCRDERKSKREKVDGVCTICKKTFQYIKLSGIPKYCTICYNKIEYYKNKIKGENNGKFDY